MNKKIILTLASIAFFTSGSMAAAQSTATNNTGTILSSLERLLVTLENELNAFASAPASTQPAAVDASQSGLTATITQSLTETTSLNSSDPAPQTFKLNWSSTDATSCTVSKSNPDGAVLTAWATGTSGQRTPSFPIIGTYHIWIDCVGPSATVHQDLYHTVNQSSLSYVPSILGMSLFVTAHNVKVGTPVTVTANFIPATGDTLTDTGIGQNGFANAIVSTGLGQSQSLQNPITYTFMPTNPGTYYFFPEGTTKAYPTWATIPSSQWATVTVTAAPLATTVPASASSVSSGSQSGVTNAVPAIPTSKNQFIADLYSCILSREPDASGLAAWTSLPASVTLGLIYQSWFASPEYLADNVPDQQFVTQLYNCILFRQPDAAGYNLYVQALQNNTQTRIGLVQTFVTSNEFLAGQGPQLKAATGFALAPAVDPAVTPAPVQTVTNLNQNDPYTWLLKSVCVNSNNQVVAIDPYGGCPAGDSIRKMQSTDPLPYNNYDLSDVQVHDSVPIQDLSGNTLALVYFDWAPFHQFNLTDGSDGWDVYGVQGGWAGGLLTKDGGAFSQVFYGSNCSIGTAGSSFLQAASSRGDQLPSESALMNGRRISNHILAPAMEALHRITA